jgi:hypothetical protein
MCTWRDDVDALMESPFFQQQASAMLCTEHPMSSSHPPCTQQNCPNSPSTCSLQQVQNDESYPQPGHAEQLEEDPGGGVAASSMFRVSSIARYLETGVYCAPTQWQR